jgi:hypothetical protein
LQLKDNYKYLYINNGCATASITTQVDEGLGSLILVSIGSASSSSIDITDGSSGSSSTANMGNVQANKDTDKWFLAAYAQGLKVTMGSPGKATIVYDPHT